MSTVWVESWASETSGGFDWFYDRESAQKAFDKDTGSATPWGQKYEVRIRLVPVDVPDILSRAGITLWLDWDIDYLESEGPAVADVTLNKGKHDETDS